MPRRVEASRRFAGPWWVAVALLGIEPDDVVTPVLEELHAHLTPSTSVARHVEIECGPVERTTGVATMPVRWRDARHPSAFPEMDAELRLIEIDDNVTELQLTGEYEPPLGVLGTIADAVAGHRIAQRTIDETTQRLARRMEAMVSKHIGTAHAASRDPPSPAP